MAVFICEYRGIKWPGSGYVHVFEVLGRRTLCGAHPVKHLAQDAEGVWDFRSIYPESELQVLDTSSINCKACQSRYEKVPGANKTAGFPE